MGNILDVRATTPSGVVPFRVVVKDDTVAFYDQRYRFTENGQFTGASYYLSDFCKHVGGLSLYGGEPSWYLGATTVREIQCWLYTNRYVDRIGATDE